MRTTDIQPGVACYYAPGANWRTADPAKAVIVDATPRRIVRQRWGAFTAVTHRLDPSGRAVLVDLHDSSGIRRSVPVLRRDLRGLWNEMLNATGRTEAGVLARTEAVREMARTGVTADRLLRMASVDPGVDDETFAVLARAADGRPVAGQ